MEPKNGRCWREVFGEMPGTVPEVETWMGGGEASLDVQEQELRSGFYEARPVKHRSRGGCQYSRRARHVSAGWAARIVHVAVLGRRTGALEWADQVEGTKAMGNRGRLPGP